MSVFVYELWESREFDINVQSPTGVVKYIAYGSTDETAIYTAVRLVTPALFRGLWLRGVKISPQGGGVWFAEAHYGITPGADQEDQTSETPPPPPPPPADTDPLGPEFSFDTTGQTQHIVTSSLTRSSTGIGGFTTVDFKGLIGVDGERVQGVDVVSRKFGFTITLKCPAISSQYLGSISEVTGTLNDSKWLGWDIQEVLYAGATGSFRSPEEGWVIQHNFLAGKTRTNVSFAGATIPEIRPHDYVWVMYAKAVDGTSLVQKPLQVNVERVYPTGSFKELGIYS